MGFSQLLGLLGLLPVVLGSPAPQVTASAPVPTTTAATTSVAPLSSPPVPLSDLTVWRTRTVTRWSRTTTIIQPRNCTRTVLASNAPPRPTPIPSRSTPVLPTGASVLPLFARQENPSSAAPTQPASSSVAPPSRVTGVPRRTRTRTTTVYITPTAPLSRTTFACDKTVTYLYTQDRSTTVVRTYTSYPNIVTATSLIDCLPIGRPSSSTTRLPSTRRTATTYASRVSSPPPAGPTTSAAAPRVTKRQGTASLGPLPTAATSAPVMASSGTVTVHLTRTIYSVVTTINNRTTTALAYGCKPTSILVVLSSVLSGMLPSVPIPSAPIPSLPAPSVPAPSVPAPSMPAPSVPIPSMPAPSIPAPTAPVPSVPAPSVPAPTAPIVSTPTVITTVSRPTEEATSV